MFRHGQVRNVAAIYAAMGTIDFFYLLYRILEFLLSVRDCCRLLNSSTRRIGSLVVRENEYDVIKLPTNL